MSPTEAKELMRVDEEMRASQRECAQLRADLATVTADWKLERSVREDISEELRVELAAHAETRKALEDANSNWHSACDVGRRLESRLDSTRAELAKAEARVTEIENLLFHYAQIDGEHHKTWVLDQIARIIYGETYDRKVAEYCAGEDGPETYSWDVGIAP